MADYIYPYGEAPDDAEYVLGEANQDLPNGLVILPGPGIQIQQGPGTITITNTGGSDTSEQSYWTADDETGTLPNSFKVEAGTNISIDYTPGTVTISASGGSGGGSVNSFSANNGAPLFNTSVTNPTTDPVLSFNMTSSVINALATGLSGTGYVTQNGTTFADRTLTGSSNISVTNGDGTGGNPVWDVTPRVYTVATSSLINALSSSTTGGTGGVYQLSDTAFINRSLTGTTNRVVITNPNGVAGAPTFDVGSDVYTISSSNTLNALASTTGTGFMAQNGALVIDRTLQGTANRLTITNPTGAAGDPIFDVGINVYTISSSNTLNSLATANFPPANGNILIGGGGTYEPGNVTALSGVQINLGAGLIQIGASGALGGTVTDFSTDSWAPVYDVTVDTSTTTPHLTVLVNQQASGAALIGPLNGADAEPTFRRLLGDDLTDAVVAGANVTIDLISNQLVISSTASGGGGGSVTSVSSGNLSPVFTSNTANPTTTPAISYTLSNTASANFLAGPASGGDGPWVSRGILGTDLAGALAAGSYITLTPQVDPNTRIVIGLSTGIDAAYIADGSVSNTEFQYLDGASSNIQAQLDQKQPLSGTLNALSTGLAGTGYVIQDGPNSFVERSLATANSNHISITNPNGVAGASTFDIGPDVFTISTSNILNRLASSVPTNGQIPIGDGVNFQIAAPFAGPGIQITTGAGTLQVLSSGAANALITAGDLAPLFTTTESANNLSFTLSQFATGTYYGVAKNGSTPANPSALTLNPGAISDLNVNLGLFIDGASAVISSGEVGTVPIDFDGLVVGWTITSLQSATTVLDVFKSSYANYPAMVSMVGAGTKPGTSSAFKNKGGTADWTTTAVSNGDILRFALNSNDLSCGIGIALKILRTS